MIRNSFAIYKNYIFLGLISIVTVGVFQNCGGNFKPVNLSNTGIVSSSSTQSDSGIIPTNPPPTSLTAATCPAMSVTKNSTTGKSVCSFSLPSKVSGQSVSGKSANNGTITGMCKSDGKWDITYNCPEPSLTSCAGGTATIASPSGKVSCSFNYPQTVAGKSYSGSGTNNGSISGTCKADGNWDASYICPDPNVVSCPGGKDTIASPSGAVSCVFSYPQTNAGKTYSGTGTNNGTIGGNCKADGSWDVSYLCPDPKVVSCPGGKDTIASPSGAISCVFTYPQTNTGKTYSGTGTNNGTISGSCKADGTWDATYSCPDPNVVSCTGGKITIASPSGAVKCDFNYPQTIAGKTYSGTGTNNGTISGSCKADGSWDSSYSCPDPKVVSCSGGKITIPSPSGAVSCEYSYPQTNAGKTYSGTGTNNGTISGSCKADGNWDTSYSCPDPNVVSCPGGKDTIASPSGAVSCVFAYPQTNAGKTYSGTGTNNGTISGSCKADGSWDASYTCPDPNVVSCPGGKETIASPSGAVSCAFIYPQTNAGKTYSGTGTNNGTIGGNCRADGTWDVSYSCPDPNVVSCPGGKDTIASPSGAVSCLFTYPQTNAGKTYTGTGTNNGAISGTCKADGKWDATYSCPDPKVASCAGGKITIASPSGAVSCEFVYPQTNAGKSYSGTGTNNGIISGSCKPDGAWDASYSCPDPNIVSCPGGKVSIASPSGGVTCDFAYPQTNAGKSYSGAGTNNGTISGSCKADGTWDASYLCPDPNVASCSGGKVTIPSPSGAVSCFYTYPQTNAGKTYSGTGTNNGTISGTCKADGSWEASYSCPDPNVVSCPGGKLTIASPSGAVNCDFSYPQTNAGKAYSGSGTNNGSISGTCKADGTWDASYLCPDVNVISCPGGKDTIPSKSGGSSCLLSYPQTDAGKSYSGTGTNGGTVSGTCMATIGTTSSGTVGIWKNVIATCP